MADDAVIRLGYDNSKVRAGAKETQSIMAKTATGVQKSFAPMTAGLGRAFAAIGGASAIRGFAAEMGSIDDMAKRLGVSAESIQKVGNVSQLAGTDIETVAKLMTKLTIASTESAEKFEALGISASAFANADLEGQVLMLAKAYEGANGDQGQMIKLMDLLGARGQAVLPLLSQGYADLADQIEKVKVVNNEAVKSAAEFDDAYDAAIMTAKSFFGQIVSGYEDAIYYATAYKMQLQGLGDAQKMLKLREEDKAKKAEELKKKAQNRVKAEVEESDDKGTTKDKGKSPEDIKREEFDQIQTMNDFRVRRDSLRWKEKESQEPNSAFDGKRRKIEGYKGGSKEGEPLTKDTGLLGGGTFKEFFHPDSFFDKKDLTPRNSDTFNEFFHPTGKKSASTSRSTTNTKTHNASADKGLQTSERIATAVEKLASY